MYIHLLVNDYLKILFFLPIHLMMEVVSHGLSKTPDLILTFFNGQYIIYALVNVEIKLLKDI